MKKSHAFALKVWLWPGDQAAWHFVSLPKAESATWREKHKGLHRGWNSIKVKAKIGKTTWETSVFFDTKSKQYLLPLKAAVRKVEGIYEGDLVKIKIDLI